jgi:hypothetical protein
VTFYHAVRTASASACLLDAQRRFVLLVPGSAAAMPRVEEEVDTVEVSGMAAAWCTAFAGPTRCQRHEQTATLMCTAVLSDAAMGWLADRPAEAVLAVGGLVRQTAADAAMAQCTLMHAFVVEAVMRSCNTLDFAIWMEANRVLELGAAAQLVNFQRHPEAAQPVLKPRFMGMQHNLAQLAPQHVSWALQQSCFMTPGQSMHAQEVEEDEDDSDISDDEEGQDLPEGGASGACCCRKLAQARHA